MSYQYCRYKNKEVRITQVICTSGRKVGEYEYLNLFSLFRCIDFSCCLCASSRKPVRLKHAMIFILLRISISSGNDFQVTPALQSNLNWWSSNPGRFPYDTICIQRKICMQLNLFSKQYYGIIKMIREVVKENTEEKR